MAYGYKRKRRYSRKSYRRGYRSRFGRARRSVRSRSRFAPRVPGAGRVPRSLVALAERLRGNPDVAKSLMSVARGESPTSVAPANSGNVAGDLLKVVKSTRYGRKLASRANWWKEFGQELLNEWIGNPRDQPRTREALWWMVEQAWRQFAWQNGLASDYEYSHADSPDSDGLALEL